MHVLGQGGSGFFFELYFTWPEKKQTPTRWPVNKHSVHLSFRFPNHSRSYNEIHTPKALQESVTAGEYIQEIGG
ncbi:MAG: hypothetical protein ACJAUP_000915 [Cellvibrionaceae bacterium]|jgi:hypothetical protein